VAVDASTLAFGHHEDRIPTHGYEASRQIEYWPTRCRHFTAAVADHTAARMKGSCAAPGPPLAARVGALAVRLCRYQCPGKRTI
jgi:hypothetical protein